VPPKTKTLPQVSRFETHGGVRIYQITCERLGIAPERAIFLDDLGINLKPARALGMRTIKVGDPETALDELESILGHPVR